MQKEIDSLDHTLVAANAVLNKSYLPVLGGRTVVNTFSGNEISDEEYNTYFNDHIRFFNVEKIILNRSENARDKLVSVFNAIWNTNATFLLLIQGNKKSVSIKIGVKTAKPGQIGMVQGIIEKTVKGNFPGTTLSGIKKGELKEVYDFGDSSYVSAVTTIPGIRSKEENEGRQYIQGLEKVIDSLQGQEYSLLFIANPVSNLDLAASRSALESLYSSLVPFSESQYTVGKNTTDSFSRALTVGTSSTISHSVSQTVSHTVGKNTSISEGESRSGTFGFNAGVRFAVALGGFGSITKGTSYTETRGFNSSDTKGETTTNGITDATNESETETLSTAIGQSEGVQIKFENHAIKQMMLKIDETLKRYDTCADLGMWNCAMYCIAPDEQTSTMAASVYQSVMRGENSSLEASAITCWDEKKSKDVLKCLRRMEHPVIAIEELSLTPGTLVSSAELAIQAGLPNRSVPGIPVLECAEFGRNVSSFDSLGQGWRVELGCIFHMHHQEELEVALNPDSLTSHTFITGSTGSGKSNTVYQLLEGLEQKGVNFLVVEPAKGEYKEVLGGLPGVSVYGTNPQLTPLLRINPFSFPHGNGEPSRNIHILEHLDRLIEIFNVCWPMYAAMPAVLKEAVEKSYEDCGWNLTESTNPYGDNLYPTFADVTRNIRTIIDSSEYDAENKGAYKGALVTRLKSLTNGINGLIFTTNELSAQELFDRKVIVDLSRVGSTETKSLIMGLLVLKLQEHRMTEGHINSPLRHVTVLEEAHNLLKHTSTEQSQDSGNLLGKSVEMLANAIAEMRSYGEGFIIADQAPGLLDLSVIRNTNTKIIMRLPDQDDRELVGRAANLNDDQITELARLPVGVAAVYQNNWIEPVLCQVERYENEKKFEYQRQDGEEKSGASEMQQRLELARLLCNAGDEMQLKEQIENELKGSCLNGSLHVAIKQYMAQGKKPDYDKLSFIVAQLLPEFSKTLRNSAARNPHDIHIWRDDVQEHIEKELRECDFQTQEQTALRNSILQCILQNYVHAELNRPGLIEQLLQDKVR